MSALATMPACRFDGHGTGDSGGLDSPGDSESSDDPTSTGTPTNTGTGGDGTTGSDTTGSDTTTDGTPCDGAYSLLLWVENAQLSDMQLQPALGLPEQPNFAYSEQPALGTATFTMPLQCTGTFQVWGLVWDRYPGQTTPNNADSFTAQFDDGEQMRWEYGCGTSSLPEGSWSWQPLQAYVDVCPSAPVAVPLSASTHTFSLTNIESGNGQEGNYAGIAAIVISSDPSHDPYLDYDPGG